MAINFDSMLGIHQHTLGVRTQRAEMIANNIANADTPGYKAKGMEFQQALKQATGGSGNYKLDRTHGDHFSVELKPSGTEKYRVPNQPDTGDGNTVDIQLEQNLYMQNALEYQMSTSFLDARISGVKKAITGGQ
ncbi:flagellar basal-body rod protein FlgB [Pseudidiomarina planktonica]|uniref:Flagellar basal body rod protein FlgB n=1 Tax=Pseudidiomarina planktonica TaxID=1323738 RepID=A0A1Y6EHF4_9GAMM|nr:flagellar basal body rod protein FlgB [Pseudidiomarina planktonica]RUO65887.1 flagellar basal body rod protein FlgB [Pseudidiomarina planktonica]SMQ62044.1 flagellar basal-body rod protein FlgB [Pseudidiomarina planktonica]